jgi:hypothetical protein
MVRTNDRGLGWGGVGRRGGVGWFLSRHRRRLRCVGWFLGWHRRRLRCVGGLGRIAGFGNWSIGGLRRIAGFGGRGVGGHRRIAGFGGQRVGGRWRRRARCGQAGCGSGRVRCRRAAVHGSRRRRGRRPRRRGECIGRCGSRCGRGRRHGRPGGRPGRWNRRGTGPWGGRDDLARQPEHLLRYDLVVRQAIHFLQPRHRGVTGRGQLVQAIPPLHLVIVPPRGPGARHVDREADVWNIRESSTICNPELLHTDTVVLGNPAKRFAFLDRGAAPSPWRVTIGRGDPYLRSWRRRRQRGGRGRRSCGRRGGGRRGRGRRRRSRLDSWCGCRRGLSGGRRSTPTGDERSLLAGQDHGHEQGQDDNAGGNRPIQDRPQPSGGRAAPLRSLFQRSRSRLSSPYDGSSGATKCSSTGSTKLNVVPTPFSVSTHRRPP